MQLVADRFAREDDDRVVDLATGERVILITSAATAAAEQLTWMLRCDALQKLQHRSIVPLVDFGSLGRSRRFEAWRCGAPWVGSREEAMRALDSAGQFLRAIGLTSGAASPEAVRAGAGGAMVLPDRGTGYPDTTHEHPEVHARHEEDRSSFMRGDAAFELRGISRIERPAVATLAEMFHLTTGSRPLVAALWGPRGSGKSTVVRTVASMARAQGLIPVAAHLVRSRYAGLWQGRSLFIIADEGSSAAWPVLLDAALRAPSPHVVLVVATEELRWMDGVAMDRVRPEALVASVTPAPTDPRVAARLHRVAMDAKGLPGRFVRLVWPALAAPSTHERRHPLPRVAERPAVYGAGADAEDVPDRANTRSAWPAPGELATLRRRVQSAAAQIAGGRHTAGVRLLRQAVGGLARRDAWIDATTGALALASALLGRGRTQAARSALDDARRFAGRGGRDELLIDVAVLAGEAWIDLARLDEAEATLTAAASAARAAGDGLRAAIATIGLARALFWRGRYADAASALGGPSDDWPAALRLRHALLQARIAVGQREFSRAMSLVNDASRTAGANSAAAQAATSCTAAFVHLAVGDLDAVGADAATAIAAARAGHDPLRAIRARLLLAEAERRRGRKPASLSRLQRLVARGAAPVTVKALCELVAALSSPAEAPDAIVRRHIGATGLEALRLFTPLPTGAAAYDPIVDDIVAILRACQTADDEVAVLKEVCGRVRQQLHAAAVACIAARSSSYEIVAGDGARIEAAIAERAVTSNITIAPHRAADRIEAAAPIHYAGGTIGALCARWTIGSPYELSRAPTVLAMAAAATAPVLSALLAHRARAAAPPLVGLLGVTAAMCELRQAAERAAAAPFAVLIDGESGSGKELVARAIHRAGSRRDRPFCTLNCAALPDDLIEAELFGHARGSFTGAVADHAGVFEEAHGGTVFLDEVGELSPRAQAKVLRVIQEGELRRIGETVSRRVDVRIVSATNRDLRQEVAAGRFRLDLLYRLDVIRISVPPLRERREDIAMLADHFWREATARIGSRATLAPATVAALARYDWPGNVRELQNVLASLAVRSPKRGVVPPTALPPQFGVSHAAGHWRLDAARRTFEERFVRAALVRSGGHRARAAEELGVTRQGLTKLMTRLGISSE